MQERVGGDSQLFFFFSSGNGSESWNKNPVCFYSGLSVLLVISCKSTGVSIENVLGKVKTRAKDEAGSNEVAEEA